ncbi:MAG: hypothetical protein KF753_08520 [Caldilineaceae bacterium]|nr:hypothetical protein [Caldilineaceae bacterium]
MEGQRYTASLSRSQGRSGWAVIFRHPLRSQKNGQPGLRIRRGLGTPDDEAAQSLVNQLNEILGDKRMWSLTSRSEASIKYDEKVVSAFYDPISPEEQEFQDSWRVRNSFLPLPDKSDGYARAMLLGTTGVGKTTLLRQLIGTDPEKERFPSTAPAKTTIADTEIIMTDDPIYQAVVTFFPYAQVRIYVEECIVAAVAAHVDTGNRAVVERKLLEHNDQRFRLSYLIGRTKTQASKSENESEDELGDLNLDGLDDDESMGSQQETTDEDALAANSEMNAEEREALIETLEGYLDTIQQMGDTVFQYLKDELGDPLKELSKDDEDALKELLEDALCERDGFADLVGQILEDIESRFDYLQDGDIEKHSDGWPAYWTYQNNDRTQFIETVRRFSSNYAPNFGRLLTPLVNGIRVAGPFVRDWYKRDIKLVLIDGEGLGHTPSSAASISTSITRRYDDVDAIILVDHAAQPMLAAPVQVLKSMVRTGHNAKLLVCFTHFDEIHGVNLPTVESRKGHVISSYDNAASDIGREMGARWERVLKERQFERIFFLSDLHERPSKKNLSTFQELGKLIKAIEDTIIPPPPTEVFPIYDDANLVLGIQKATQKFRRPWRARLGLGSYDQISSEHWARIKALSRRLGELNQDEYNGLRPVADFLQELLDHIEIFISNPLQWDPSHAPDEMKKMVIDNILQTISREFDRYISDRLFRSKKPDWYRAYISYRGPGSTRLRAKAIEDIYEYASPIPDEVPNSITNEFLTDVRRIVQSSVEQNRGRFGFRQTIA